jgi:hypothetical protein
LCYHLCTYFPRCTSFNVWSFRMSMHCMPGTTCINGKQRRKNWKSKQASITLPSNGPRQQDGAKQDTRSPSFPPFPGPTCSKQQHRRSQLMPLLMYTTSGILYRLGRREEPLPPGISLPSPWPVSRGAAWGMVASAALLLRLPSLPSSPARRLLQPRLCCLTRPSRPCLPFGW